MASKLFVISSTIAPRSGNFTYANTRSHFTTEERFRQTVFTINSIQNAYPDAQIVLLDSSDDYQQYKANLIHIRNFEYLPVKDLSEEAAEIVNTNKNKSLCECYMMNTFYTHRKKYIKEFDFMFKVSGRYFLFDFYDLFSDENKDKIFFKRPLNFEWNDAWNYGLVDLRKQQNNNRIHQYCNVLYGFGTMHLEKFMDIAEATIHFLKQPNMIHYDIETLSYYFTRPYKDSIIETNWMVSGWDGATGKFWYYQVKYES